MKIRDASFVILALAAMTVSGRAQNLIQNGMFTANASDYTTFPGYGGAPSHWTLTSDSGSVGENGPDAYSSGFAGSGRVFGPANTSTDNMGDSIGDFAFIQNGTTTSPVLSQSFNVVSGLTYTLTYDAGSRRSTAGGGSNDEGFLVEVTDGAAAGLGTLLFEQTSSLPNDKFYANGTSGNNPDLMAVPYFATTVGSSATTFTADQTGTVTLAFSFVGAAGDSAGFTNVDVAAVPEPSTYALMLMGLGALIAFAAFRSRSAAV